MAVEEDKYIKSLDSLRDARVEIKGGISKPLVDSFAAQALPDNPTVAERIKFMIKAQGGQEVFFEKINANEINMKDLLEEHQLSEEDLDSL